MTKAKHLQITIVGFTSLGAVIWAGSESSWWLLLFLIVPVALLLFSLLVLFLIVPVAMLLFSLLVWLNAWVSWKHSWANSPASGPLYKQYRRDR